MDYTIDEDGLRGGVEYEVSQVADAAYADDGTSLYDSIVLTEKDAQTVTDLIHEAIRIVIASMQDIASYATQTVSTVTTNKIVFSVPDFDVTQSSVVTLNIDNFIKAHACAGIFRQRRPALVEEYTTRAQVALDNAKSLLRKRQAPSRS